MARPIGWVLLALAAILLSFGIWDVPQPVGPPLPAARGLLTEGPGWYLRAGYLALVLILAGAGGWLLRRAGGSSSSDQG